MSLNNDQLKADFAFMLGDLTVTLSVVFPAATSGLTFTASKQDVTIGYEVDKFGREVKRITRFYIDPTDIESVLIPITNFAGQQLTDFAGNILYKFGGGAGDPSKGWIITEGTNQYRIFEIKLSADGYELRLDCIEENARN